MESSKWLEKLELDYPSEWLQEECESNLYWTVKEQGLETVEKWLEYGELSAASAYLGNLLNMYPSGKYYVPFACSGVTEEEAMLDEGYREVLDQWADSNGGWIQCGEGDPLDLFFCWGNQEGMLAKVMKEIEDANE